MVLSVLAGGAAQGDWQREVTQAVGRVHRRADRPGGHRHLFHVNGGAYGAQVNDVPAHVVADRVTVSTAYNVDHAVVAYWAGGEIDTTGGSEWCARAASGSSSGANVTYGAGAIGDIQYRGGAGACPLDHFLHVLRQQSGAGIELVAIVGQRSQQDHAQPGDHGDRQD